MATYYSTQRTGDTASPPVMHNPAGVTYKIPWDFTVGTELADGDVVELCKIPAGSRVYIQESYFRMSDTATANTLLDIGYKAYKDKNGDTVAADPNGIVAAHLGTVTTMHSLNTATTSPLGAAVIVEGSYGILDLSDAHEDVTLILTCDDGTGTYAGTVGDVYEGWFTVQHA